MHEIVKYFILTEIQKQCLNPMPEPLIGPQPTHWLSRGRPAGASRMEGQRTSPVLLAQERHARIEAEADAAAEIETLRRTASELQQVSRPRQVVKCVGLKGRCLLRSAQL